jgi:Lrp/AsnC family transcriptional regulator for asnA, asnC and gidA
MGVIEIAAVPIPKNLGYIVNADVFVEVEPGKAVAVARQIAGYENVPYVACSTGTNDISVQVVARTNAELFDFVNGVLGNIDGVRKTTTSVVPLVIKNVYHWRIPKSLIESGEDFK